MKYLMLLLLSSAPLCAFAGGTSSIGGAPIAIEYSCQDRAGNVTVTLGHDVPTGDAILVVVTVNPSGNVADTHVARIPGKAPGGALEFKGDRYDVELIVDGPIWENGTLYVDGQITDNQSPTPPTELVCQNAGLIGN